MLLDGSVRDMVFNSDKSKLLASSVKRNKDSADIYQYYIFEMEHVKRKLHDIEGIFTCVNKKYDPSSKIIHVVHKAEEEQSLSTLDLQTKKLTTIYTFSKEDGDPS